MRLASGITTSVTGLGFFLEGILVRVKVHCYHVESGHFSSFIAYIMQYHAMYDPLRIPAKSTRRRTKAKNCQVHLPEFDSSTLTAIHIDWIPQPQQ
jgi:hypothetical protein